MQIISLPLGIVMRLCYQWVQNYGAAIILFTIITKVILFPVSLWIHTNGIKMVRIQSSINRLKVKYFGDHDRIAEEQGVLYKKEKYSPFAGIVPLILQLVLLLGLIQVIYHPMSYILNIPSALTQRILSTAQGLAGIDPATSTAELLALNYIQSGVSLKPFMAIEGMTQSVMDGILQMHMAFGPFQLSAVPLEVGGILLLIPIMAALASVILSLSQNVHNPLQAEQEKRAQFGSMALSVGISLFVGFFVPGGVGFYWIFSNLFTILQQVVLNRVYPPKKHIDYPELEASKAALKAYQDIGGGGGPLDKALAKREKADYKRFFSIVNKHLVFYSEGSGFYKYFESVLTFILDRTNIIIHYVTSDPNDQIFALAEKEPKIKPYYIGEKKLITLFMKLEADVVVMTMTDLENYHYKRSYMRKDIEYVYMFHYPLSTHLVVHTGALNHYDTILCVGEFQFEEIRKTEQVYHLPEKKLIACGYGQLEKLRENYLAMEKVRRDRKKVLIAPSWQEDNILDYCVDDLLSALRGKGFDVVVRPHPEYVKRYKPAMDKLVQRYAPYAKDGLTFELDFSSSASIYDSDVVISDWSGTAYEFAFATGKPAVFIDTPPKIHNPEYTLIGVEPLEFTLRDQIGIRVDPKNMADLADRIKALMEDEGMGRAIADARDTYIANFSHSGEVGGKYIISAIQAHIERRKNEKQ